MSVNRCVCRSPGVDPLLGCKLRRDV